MKQNLIGLLLPVLLLLASFGCAKVEEPWVQNAQQLQQERYRSPELQQQLRARLYDNLRDR